MTEQNTPLVGLRVLDLGRYQAGPRCALMFARMGAEVIKVEVPGVGDRSRTAGELKGGISSYFETNNRGVKSLTLNLKSEEGKAILYKLVKEADIFGQNFRPGAAEKNGFGYTEKPRFSDVGEA